MPVMIPLTTAQHGGRVHTGLCGTEHCGVDCNCGCPYAKIEEQGKVEWIAEVEARYPGQWLAFVIPPGEDEEHPERGMLVVHSPDDNEVWDAVRRITHNQVVHVYFNGPYDLLYDVWANSEPLPPARQEEIPLDTDVLIPLLEIK
ncbi:MAG: hypothetical protein KatS3mg057_3025 [Herpetosiphonaceae bacterium]|nr:MAG: hypothetical protein KatS3mg057_3025 [Herpetosiphonaceae bacterium]